MTVAERATCAQPAKGPAMGPTVAPPIVHDVLRSPGRPLDSGVRRAMEARFDHDFSRVRVHTDATAAESALRLGARAYTVGNEIVFGAGGEPSSTAAGRRLLAHELAHVVQQGDRSSANVMPSCISALADPLEDEAERAERAIENDEPLSVERRTGKPGTLYRAPLSPLVDVLPPVQAIVDAIQALAASCGHSAALTWPEFTAAAPAASSFEAETHFHFDLTTAAGHDVVRAIFDPVTSWVKPRWPNASNRALNGCAARVLACDQEISRRLGLGQVGVTWGPLRQSPICPASVQYDPSVVARSQSDCATAIGAECDRVAQLESARLLRHEQGHYDLACALARKGTTEIMFGQAPAAMLATVRSAAGRQTVAYDNDSGNGCIPAQQAAWETRIGDGLPAVTLRPPASTGRSGRP
jgi:hypothetical protein